MKQEDVRHVKRGDQNAECISRLLRIGNVFKMQSLKGAINYTLHRAGHVSSVCPFIRLILPVPVLGELNHM
jgi:hypothetical protein